jgi:hypothetical protein
MLIEFNIQNLKKKKNLKLVVIHNLLYIIANHNNHSTSKHITVKVLLSKFISTITWLNLFLNLNFNLNYFMSIFFGFLQHFSTSPLNYYIFYSDQTYYISFHSSKYCFSSFGISFYCYDL